MIIQNISKQKKEITADLTADELVIICNMLHSKMNTNAANKTFLRLYKNMMLARDLCQYGRIDNFCMNSIIKCHDMITDHQANTAPDDDITWAT